MSSYQSSRKTILRVSCKSWLTTTTMNGKADYLEGQSKRNNIIIDSIPEPPRESWEESEDKVHEVFAVKLWMDEKRIEVEQVHRTGTNSGDRPSEIPLVQRQSGSAGKC